MRRSVGLLFCLFLSLTLLACGGGSTGSDSGIDAGIDADSDASVDDGGDVGADLLSAPSLIGIDPAQGPAEGGSVVQVSGSHFVEGASLRFGAVVAGDVQVLSSSLIQVVSPPGSPGAVAVRVTNPDGQFAELAAGFTYFAAVEGDCPRQNNCDVAMAQFVFGTGNSGDSVKLAGEFTGWLDGAIPMQGDGAGNFSTAVRLKEGRYEYKFVVTNSEGYSAWQEDPAAGEPEPFFGNSVRLHDNPCTPNLDLVQPSYGQVFASATVEFSAGYTDGEAGAGLDEAGICLVVDGQARRTEFDPVSNTISAILTDLPEGNHHWWMSAADLEGHRSAELQGMFTVNAEGLPPVADAGPTQFAVPGQWVVLDGTWSQDPDGLAITGYSWSQEAGTPVTLSAQPVTPWDGYSCGWDCDFDTAGEPPATQALMGFAPPDLGTYRFSLTVSDADGSSESAMTEVVVVDPGSGDRPKARIQVNRSNDSVTLEAVGSAGASYTWYADVRNPAEVLPPASGTSFLLRPQDLPVDGAYFFYALPSLAGSTGEPANALVHKRAGAVFAVDFDAPPDWLPDAQIYEIYARGFADSDGDGEGDFAGMMDKLDYLQDLGVNTLWLMPVFESADHAHGYHTVNYFRAERDYGSNAELLALIQEAHVRGIRVVLDLVINHTSRQHPMFQAAVDANSRFHDYFIWFANRAESDPLISRYGFGRELGGNRLSIASGWGDIPDVNLSNPAARAYFFGVAHYWMDPNGDGDFSDGVDGFRLDHVTGPAHRVWRALRRDLKSRRPDLLLLAEVFRDFDNDGQGYGIKDYYKGEFDLAFTFPFYWLAGGMFKNGESVGGIDWLMQAISERFASDAVMCFFIENHDVPWYSTIYEEWDRSEDKMVAANTLMQTLPNSPQLLYGQELGSSTWRGMMPWAKDTEGNTLKQAYRELMLLRRDHEALRRGTYVRLPLLGGADQDVFAFARVGAEETLVVIINVRDWQALDVSVDLSSMGGTPSSIQNLLGTGTWNAAGAALESRVLQPYERWIGVLQGG